MNQSYTQQGYALVATNDESSTHWFGGEPYHSGAKCPVCKIPLLLLADLDCLVLREKEAAKLFHELDRLPLYYCWRCCADRLSYRVISPAKVKVLCNEGRRQEDDFPYKDYPDSFERKPAELVPIPYETAKLLIIAQEVGCEWLSKHDLEVMQRGLKDLRHEDFCENPMDSSITITEHLDIGFTDSMRKYIAITTSGGAVEAPAGKTHAFVRDSKALANAWREKLDPDDARIVREVVGDDLFTFYAQW